MQISVTKPRGRYFRLVSYLLQVVAGCVQSVTPTRTMVEVCGPFISHVWGVLFIIGGVACLIGEARKHWVGEYIGLPAISLTWCAYGLAVLYTNHGEPPRFGVAFMLLAIGFMYGGRWLDAAAQRKIAILENGDSEWSTPRR